MTDQISDTQLEALIEAAIDCEVLHSPGTAGFQKEGDYYVFHGEGGARTQIFPRRGYGRLEVDPANTSVISFDADSYFVNGESAAAMYTTWENRIYQLFHPYRTMPLPESFADAVSAFDPLLRSLQIQPQQFTHATDSEGQPLPFEVSGNDEFSVMTSVSDEFGNMQGLTTDAFKTYYLDRFPYVVQRQYGVMQMLKASVVGEKKVWEALHQDVLTLVSEATTTFEHNGQSHSTDLAQDLAIVGVVLSVAGLFPSLGTSPAIASTILGALTLLPLPDRIGTDPKIELPGEGAEAIWSSVVKASDNLKKAAADQERAFDQSMTQIKALMDAQPDRFDLGSIDDHYGPAGQSADEELASETDPDKIVGVMDVNTELMTQAGQRLIDISGIFRGAANGLDSLPGSGAWSRSGEIGMGFIGHFESTSALAAQLSSYLRGTQNALTNAGEVVKIVARDFHQGDAVIAGDLRTHQREVEAQGAGYGG